MTSLGSSPGSSSAGKRHVNSPFARMKRQREDSNSERRRLDGEIEQTKEEIRRLEQSARRGNRRDRDIYDAGVEGEETVLDEDLGDIEAIEAVLRDMDDGALAALLTQSIPSASLEDMLPYLTEARGPIPAPAKSAGVEGTGAGSEIDKEAADWRPLEGGSNEAARPAEETAETALESRISRGKELLQRLAQFTLVDFYYINSTAPREVVDEARVVRTMTMAGKVQDGLGAIQITLDVEEELLAAGSGTMSNPRIASLTVDIEEEELFRALGEDHLRSIVAEKNLPAVMLSARTLVPLSKTRLRLFQSIQAAFPDLTRSSLQSNHRLRSILEEAKGDEDNSPLSALIDPQIMERLSLQNDRGARLDVIFKIGFNRWGHAAPNLSIAPTIASSVRTTREAREVLQRMPANFEHMCRHVTDPYDTLTSLVTTIQAFFGLS